MITVWIWMRLVADRYVYELEPIHILISIILSILTVPIDLFLAPIEIASYILYLKLITVSEDKKDE